MKPHRTVCVKQWMFHIVVKKCSFFLLLSESTSHRRTKKKSKVPTNFRKIQILFYIQKDYRLAKKSIALFTANN